MLHSCSDGVMTIAVSKGRSGGGAGLRADSRARASCPETSSSESCDEAGFEWTKIRPARLVTLGPSSIAAHNKRLTSARSSNTITDPPSRAGRHLPRPDRQERMAQSGRGKDLGHHRRSALGRGSRRDRASLRLQDRAEPSFLSSPQYQLTMSCRPSSSPPTRSTTARWIAASPGPRLKPPSLPRSAPTPSAFTR